MFNPEYRQITGDNVFDESVYYITDCYINKILRKLDENNETKNYNEREKFEYIIKLINNNEINDYVNNNDITPCNEKRTTIFLNLYSKYISNIRKNNLFLKKIIDYVINNFQIQNIYCNSDGCIFSDEDKQKINNFENPIIPSTSFAPTTFQPTTFAPQIDLKNPPEGIYVSGTNTVLENQKWPSKIGVCLDSDYAVITPLCTGGTNPLLINGGKMKCTNKSQELWSGCVQALGPFQPTTFAPTTFQPTTFAPTIFQPTTFAPTTFTPTTFQPTTFAHQIDLKNPPKGIYVDGINTVLENQQWPSKIGVCSDNNYGLITPTCTGGTNPLLINGGKMKCTNRTQTAWSACVQALGPYR